MSRREELVDLTKAVISQLGYESFDATNPDDAEDFADAAVSLAVAIQDRIDSELKLPDLSDGMTDKVKEMLVNAGFPADMEVREVSKEDVIRMAQQASELCTCPQCLTRRTMKNHC